MLLEKLIHLLSVDGTVADKELAKIFQENFTEVNDTLSERLPPSTKWEAEDPMDWVGTSFHKSFR